MENRMRVTKMMDFLKREKINTWFDLGLFIDRFKESNTVPTARFRGSYKNFRDDLEKGGIAFISYGYSIDGVTIEIIKYTKIFRKNFPGIPIHMIAGEFNEESKKLIDPSYSKYEIEEAQGFDQWDLYDKFFFTKLERGSSEYNKLILDFWSEVLIITEKLGNYIEKNNLRLLYLVNVASNPGNVALTLAIVFITEYLGIPVINNNHDFYWEGGHREIERIEKEIEPGPRDFFFTNAHLGEFFSQIEVLFPWESRSWLTVNINNEQSEHVIRENGHNPVNVSLIGTAVDVEEYVNTSKRKKINTFYQFERILSRYKNTLISWSVKDIVLKNLVDPDNIAPILVGSKKTHSIKNFMAENIIFLQPTRVIGRKRIEVGFELIKKLFNKEKFRNKFKETPKLKLTILVTGPIAAGHFGYFTKLIKNFDKFLGELDAQYRSKIYLAFLFSELDKERFKKRFEKPAGIVDLYNIASLVLLPSETEGRGLPIIEASACGSPVFCRRYYPEHVFKEVIGEHLPEEERLNVIDFEEDKINDEQLERVIEEVFYPHMASHVLKHNQKVVRQRYSLEALNENLKEICYHLYLQLKSNRKSLVNVTHELALYHKRVNFSNKDLKSLINTEKRHYLPGYSRLAFMHNLKSLIDPSAFRAEEAQIKGMIHSFAYEMFMDNPENKSISFERKAEFFNAVDNIFRIQDNELKIQHDHSFAYRHRNKKNYLYRNYTFQELTGLINILYHKIIQPDLHYEIDKGNHFFTDWNLALSQITASTELVIDDRDVLVRKMKENIPLGIFSGKYVKHELEFFVLQAMRARYKLKLQEELTEEILLKGIKNKQPVYLFLREKPIRGAASAAEIITYIKNGYDEELKLLYLFGLLKIVKTNQWCVGIHFPQLGEEALKVLNYIREKKGLLISHHRNAAVMTDIVDIDRIHIDRVVDPLMANIMGIPEGSGYIQFVPAAVRTSLAYPTPVQNSLDFHKALKSADFQNLVKKLGSDKVFEAIRKDAINQGSPIRTVLKNLKEKDSVKIKPVEYSYVNGVYSDGLPWNGVLAQTKNVKEGAKWKYVTISKSRTRKVTRFVKEYEYATRKKVEIAWNGGYILNPELVGKLGLPESYIGSPLGLLITDFKVNCPPLFNKPALLVYPNGKIDIQLVNIEKGFTISDDPYPIEFSPGNYNQSKPGKAPCFYDLMYNKKYIPGNGRIIIRLAGNVVKEIIYTKIGERVDIIPVGIALSFHKSNFPKDLFQLEKPVPIALTGYEDIQYAVEAGPLLVENGKYCLDMKNEGWKTENSIRTQAARLDYTDMRGPKIAVGIDKNENLVVLTINGRIRESVGATHIDMADILLKFNIQKAMGFDPGGSSTLVVKGEVLNISPYNHDYERNIYSLPPEPRAVSNAVLGIYE
jgi:hypothetical protein